MWSEQRQKRVRQLVRKANRQRKRQAKQIDILCNDFVSAHRDFIHKFGEVSFTADFYETIIGAKGLREVLNTAARLIKLQLPDCGVGFFIRGFDDFRLYGFEELSDGDKKQETLLRLFTNEAAEEICRTSKWYSLNDLLELGLELPPAMLQQMSGAVIPLGPFGQPAGFVLICRCSQKPLRFSELNNIAAVIPGLSRAIHSMGAGAPIQDNYRSE